MLYSKSLHTDERGQTALETAIILIAFVVVASVFAFTVLSAGNASTERGEQAIYSGLEIVEATMAIKGAVVATEGGTAGQIGTVVFTAALASGGTPVNVDDAAATRELVIGYRDASQAVNEVDWAVVFIGTDDGDTLLEEGELAEFTVDLGTSLTAPLETNTEFTIEVKPPTGAVLNITRTTPAGFSPVMELR